MIHFLHRLMADEAGSEAIIGPLIGGVFSLASSLFGKSEPAPAPAAIPEPAPAPVADDEAIRRNRRRQLASLAAQRGRSSTNNTNEAEKLGG